MRAKKTQFVFSVFLISCFISLSAPCEIYKWVDDEGKVHYSEIPPNKTPKDNIETIKIRDNIDTQRASKKLGDKSKSLNERREERKKEKSDVAAKKQQLEENKARCQQAKKHLTSLQNPKVTVTEDDGTVRALGEEERQEKIKNGEKMVSEACDY